MWCALYGRDWLILNLRIQPMKRRLPPLLPYTHTKLVLYSTGCDWLSGIASLSVRCVECVCCNLANNLGPQNARRPHMHAWRPYSRPQLYINVGNQPNILSQGSVCAAAASAWRRASGVVGEVRDPRLQHRRDDLLPGRVGDEAHNIPRCCCCCQDFTLV